MPIEEEKRAALTRWTREKLLPYLAVFILLVLCTVLGKGLLDAQKRARDQEAVLEAQRAAIARAMIGGPGLLFADEPTGALNRQSSREVLDLLTGLNREGQTILMVTHDMGAAVRGNRILYLEDGKILDELTLSPYEKPDREREERASRWLSALRW